MYVECIDYEGYTSQTNEFEAWRGNWNLAHQLNYYCDGLIDQVKVVETNDQGSDKNGVTFYLVFEGLYNDPGEFKFVSSEETPLEGEEITINTEIVQPYGTNIFYDPIPFEMLRTYETEP